MIWFCVVGTLVVVMSWNFCVVVDLSVVVEAGLATASYCRSIWCTGKLVEAVQ